MLDEILLNISIEPVRAFIKEVYETKMPEERRIAALEATQLLIERLKSLKLYNEMMPNKQCDMAIAACLIHNCCYDRTEYYNNDPSSYVDVFKTRFELYPIAYQFVCSSAPLECFEYIFEIIEAQLGEDTPISRCRPVQGQPTFLVAETLWWYYSIFCNHDQFIIK